MPPAVSTMTAARVRALPTDSRNPGRKDSWSLSWCSPMKTGGNWRSYRPVTRPMVSLTPITSAGRTFALAYAWAAVAIMWAFWVGFVIFLAEPPQVLGWWPLPMVDQIGSAEQPTTLAALIDLALVALFGLQHSIMARLWFKQHFMKWIPEGLERSTYVHTANTALFVLILFWQPITLKVWNVEGTARDLLWLLFAAGWIILFLGAWSFGMRELLGVEQVRAWSDGRHHASRLRTGLAYQWLRHPMYVGVLLGIWATPRMSLGHLLLALALTAYVLIAMRYEERDLLRRFGSRYSRWRGLA